MSYLIEFAPFIEIGFKFSTQYGWGETYFLGFVTDPDLFKINFWSVTDPHRSYRKQIQLYK